MNKNLEYWNKSIREMESHAPKYDGWLDKYENYLNKSKNTTIVELGCGWGNDTAYLLEKGFEVVGCDFSEESIKVMKELYPSVPVTHMDLRDGLPFADESAEVVLGDLCLHYFNHDDTQKILADIKRVLKKGGVLLCRMNSVNDTNYGVGEGERIEENVYDTSSGLKRFFDEQMIAYFFQDWDILHMKEYRIDKFAKPKLLWEVAVAKK